MARLFDRTWRFTVDTIQTDADGTFTVEKSVRHEPNKCTLKLYNLTRDQRSHLESLSRRRGQGQIATRIELGYAGDLSVYFSGFLRTAVTTWEGESAIATIEGEDAGERYRVSRINRSFAPGASVEVVIREVATALGVGLGNLPDAIAGARLADGSTSYPEGCVVTGSSADALTRLLRSVGLRWSVQDGSLQVLAPGRALSLRATLLSPASGLVGRPSVQADGKVKARALILPDLYPGRLVRFESVDVAGEYRIEKVKVSGDTSGQDWYADLECGVRDGSR